MHILVRCVQSWPLKCAQQYKLRDCAHTFANYAPAHEILSKQQDKTQKEKKWAWAIFFNLFLGDQNEHPEHDPRAYVLTEVRAVIR